MKFDILTLFPGMFEGPLSESIISRALEDGLIEISLHDIREFAVDRHKTVDDSPYGGGPGMVMKVEPLAACIESVRMDRPKARVIMTTPRGRRLDQALVRELAKEEELLIICGRYEGVDERVCELFVDDEISLGDFVMTGGELAAMAIVDAVSRMVPGVLGCGDSAASDSFSDGLLEYPQYTRPAEFRGIAAPEMLLSGNHREIARWRRHKALERTRKARPDLLETAQLTPMDREYLDLLEKDVAS
jgi:tRNA (guanine37-N1)-methyltransferase